MIPSEMVCLGQKSFCNAETMTYFETHGSVERIQNHRCLSYHLDRNIFSLSLQTSFLALDESWPATFWGKFSQVLRNYRSIWLRTISKKEREKREFFSYERKWKRETKMRGNWPLGKHTRLQSGNAEATQVLSIYIFSCTTLQARPFWMKMKRT